MQETAFNNEMNELMLRFVWQLAVIIIAARLGGYLFRRYLKLPSVLGELVMGMLIGPFALGSIPIPSFGPLFPAQTGPLPISAELYGIATLAAIVLLFLSGLETNVGTFLQYSLVGTAVGVGGAIVSFVVGDLCALYAGLAHSYLEPPALFLGTITMATSVGITARILSEKRKMDSPEGATILAGAVLDDVLGIVALAIVVGLVKVKQEHSASIEWGHILVIAFKAIGFWVICTALGFILARRFTHMLKWFKSTETIASLALGLALLLAGLSEMAGLAMIIGAYIMGLSLSRTDLVHVIQHELQGLYNSIVPIFFCVMGMFVDFHVIKGVALFGILYSLLAILAKLFGCGIPALLMNFNLKGALRVGIGMAPRGEVALIIAGIGYSSGAIKSDLFGVAIMLTALSTLVVPPLLVKLFDEESGIRESKKSKEVQLKSISLDFPSPDLASFLCNRILQAFRNEEFYVYRISPDMPTWQIRKDDMSFSITQSGDEIVLNTTEQYEHILRLIVVEELLTLTDLIESTKKIKSFQTMGTELMAGLFQ